MTSPAPASQPTPTEAEQLHLDRLRRWFHAEVCADLPDDAINCDEMAMAAWAHFADQRAELVARCEALADDIEWNWQVQDDNDAIAEAIRQVSKP